MYIRFKTCIVQLQNIYIFLQSEQLKEYMFQKHKINVGKKFQAEIPKFNNSSKFIKMISNFQNIS